MTRNIRDISQEDFNTVIVNMPVPNMIQLVKNLYEMVQGNKNAEQVTDFLRKGAKIEAELQRRGLLTKENRHLYDKMLSQIKYKKRLFSGMGMKKKKEGK